MLSSCPKCSSTSVISTLMAGEYPVGHDHHNPNKHTCSDCGHAFYVSCSVCGWNWNDPSTWNAVVCLEKAGIENEELIEKAMDYEFPKEDIGKLLGGEQLVAVIDDKPYNVSLTESYLSNSKSGKILKEDVIVQRVPDRKEAIAAARKNRCKACKGQSTIHTCF